MFKDPKIRAQQVPRELFKLTASLTESIGDEVSYVVRFHDSRLNSIEVALCQDQTFKEVFRTAVLERMRRMKAL